MRTMRKLILIASVFGCSVTGFSQQLPQYSQYQRNQIMFNPGAAGSYDFIDITVGGRYQWVGFDNAPKTAYIYGSTVINKPKVRYNPSLRTSAGPVANPKVSTGRVKHAVGGQIVMDQYGAFQKMSFAGIYAIHLPVTEKSNISLGTKLGLSNNQFLQDRAVVLTQMPGYNGPAMTDPEYDAFIANQSSLNYFDLGMGLYYYSDDMYIGISADQLTRDMVSFGSGTANFDPNMHFNVSAAYKIPMGDNFTLMPSVIAKFMSPAPLSIEGGLQLEYKEWIWGGLSYRHTDAAIIMVGMNINEKFKFGYSYDLTLSQIKTYSTGSHEIILGIMLGR